MGNISKQILTRGNLIKQKGDETDEKDINKPDDNRCSGSLDYRRGNGCI